MNNIFENAYFGKAYKTRDGRKAILQAILPDEDKALLGIESNITHNSFESRLRICRIDGTSIFHPGLDIVSEWQEEIDEEELDKLTQDYISKNSIPYEPLLTIGEQIEAFKAGYRKAKKGGKNEENYVQ